MQWFVYIIECSDGTLYTGVTTDLTKRMLVHNAGKGAKYTAVRLPVTLMWQKACDSRSAALKEEAAIKALSRIEKKKIIMGQ